MLRAAVLLVAATFALPKPLTFFRAPPVTTLTQADAQRLLDVPVAFGAAISSLTFTKTGAPNREIATCRQFDAATKSGYDVNTSFEIAMKGFLIRACGMLEAVRRARLPQRDPIAGVTLRDLNAISSAALPLAPWESTQTPEQQARRERTSRRQRDPRFALPALRNAQRHRARRRPRQAHAARATRPACEDSSPTGTSILRESVFLELART